MKLWTVYTHKSPSGKVYVGITSNLKSRWGVKGKKYCGYECIFKHAIMKYGWDNFEHEIILDGISKSEAVYAEKYLIRWYKMHNMSYNVTDGGDGTLGVKRSKESIQRVVDTKIANNKFEYVLIDSLFNYKIFTTAKSAASYLGSLGPCISHVLSQPIGYTHKKHYVWKHDKNTTFDIASVKEAIQTAIKKRANEKSKSTKSRVKDLILASKKERESLSLKERQIRYGSYGMLGKHHSEETKRKMSQNSLGEGLEKARIAYRKHCEDIAIPIIVSKDGVFYGEYKLKADVAKAINASTSNICRALKTGIKVKGYTLSYRKEEIK